jgi:hypothetical protein
MVQGWRRFACATAASPSATVWLRCLGDQLEDKGPISPVTVAPIEKLTHWTGCRPSQIQGRKPGGARMAARTWRIGRQVRHVQ